MNIAEIIEIRMTMIFNEWARLYSENPSSFSEILDENGKPFEDYGEQCMRYFCSIAEQMDKARLLPVPEDYFN